MFRHGLHVGRAQAQLQGDLSVREVQAHEVEAQHPHPQRLMVPGQGSLREGGNRSAAAIITSKAPCDGYPLPAPQHPETREEPPG